MHDLEKLLIEQITRGLKRQTVTTPSRWAMEYRKMSKGPWRFDRFPWLREVHDSKAETNIIQKGAQLGFTETVLNITLYKIDVEGIDCLYLLPSKVPDASDFSSARFDAALELSEHLLKMFTDTRNIGHKRSGSSNLYIRGSKSVSQLKSIPVGFIVMDEVEEFGPRAIPLALERASGQFEKQIWMLSTPSIDEVGINQYYNLSTKESFFFKCPHCGKQTNLIFPECLVITAEDFHDKRVKDTHLICKECKVELAHKTKSEWLKSGVYVAEHTDRDYRGFHVNQLYATTVKPSEIAKSYLKSLTNPADEQEFYNSKLGLTHIVEGARITDAQIKACKRNYRTTDQQKTGIITMGIDVGTEIHYEIDRWLIPKGTKAQDISVGSTCKNIKFGKVKQFEEIDDLIKRYRVLFTVIDAHPEKRKALELANRFHGIVRLCYYGKGVTGKNINIHKGEPTITVDRTSWLDLSLGRFHSETIHLPLDTSFEYTENLKALVRVYEKDKDGNPVGRYVNGNREDHYAHARNYSEIALPLAINRNKNQNISEI
ncbi:MAG: hypothetical protein CMK92_06030 [Pseudomonas sp.]|nr:hypothetical protein [Pseudomonas sp.]